MKTQTLPLPTGIQLTALDPGFAECPHRSLDLLRTEDPVHRDEDLGRVFPTRFEDVRAVLSDRTLSVDPRKAPQGSYHRKAMIGNMPIEKFEPTLVHLDDPDHKRIRSLVTKAFTPAAVEALRARMQVLAVSLLDGLPERDPFDLITEYATPFPMMVIAEVLGVDARDREQFKRWSDARAHVFNPARTPQQTAEMASAQEGLNEYFTCAVEQRRQGRGTDLISALVSVEESGERLSRRDIVITCNLLLVAGNLTTTDLIGNGVLALLRHPEQLQKLKERPELLPNAVEEMLRFDPPVSQTNRLALKPITLGTTTVEAGEAITVSLLAAGHDPARHSSPHCFDVERADTGHLAFGGGAHYCLGASLARAEAEVAISLLLEHFPNLWLDSSRPIEHKRVPMFNGLKSLWVHADRG